MELVINCLGLVSDPEPLKPYLKNNLSIGNLANSSFKFRLSDGTAYLEGNSFSNAEPWLGLLDHPSINSIHLKGFSHDCLKRLPDNIEEIHFYNYNELNRVATWLHDEGLPSSDLVLDYKGGYTDKVPQFVKKITSAISHFVVPLNQDVAALSEQNPHIRTFGFDFDHQRDKRILDNPDLHFVLWSSHKHNHQLGKERYPDCSHRLHYW